MKTITKYKSGCRWCGATGKIVIYIHASSNINDTCPVCEGTGIIEVVEEIEELEKFDLKVGTTVTSVSIGNHFDDCKAKIPKPFNDGLYQG